jgi:amidase
LGQQKRDSLNSLIPQSWLLSTPLPSAEEQRDVTGKYIQQFLSSREVEITEIDAVGIVNKTTSGVWKAREVAEAFCHSAAVPHQMVCYLKPFLTAYEIRCGAYSGLDVISVLEDTLDSQSVL